MKLKRYSDYICESDSDQIVDDLLDEDIEDKKDIKVDILNMIESSVNSKDNKLIIEFIDSYLRDPEYTDIEGLINDSDIYEFYLKYTNDIDNILNDLEYFDTPPSENGIIGVYDYLVFSTTEAVKYLVNIIREENFSN